MYIFNHKIQDIHCYLWSIKVKNEGIKLGMRLLTKHQHLPIDADFCVASVIVIGNEVKNVLNALAYFSVI